MLWTVVAAVLGSSVPVLKLSGEWEIAVADNDTCPTGTDGADSMPIAYVLQQQHAARRSNGQQTYFISAVSNGIHPMVGPSLSNMARQCGNPIFNSTFTQVPQTYANYQWLQSARVRVRPS